MVLAGVVQVEAEVEEVEVEAVGMATEARKVAAPAPRSPARSDLAGSGSSISIREGLSLVWPT